MAPVDDSIANLTLAELALVLAPEIAGAAAFDGWSAAAVTAAAAEHGICEATAQLVYPGGAMDMIAAWIARIDADMAKALPIVYAVAGIMVFLGVLALFRDIIDPLSLGG